MANIILIADDEVDQVATLESFLTQRGYKVISATNGEQAFSKAVEFQPYLIVLDVLMPKIDGTEVAMLLKNNRRTKHIPIFFVTAVISPEDPSEIKDKPNLAFSKPLKLEAFLEAVRSVSTNEATH
jgi:CheY-like chemotaxis protein